MPCLLVLAQPWGCSQPQLLSNTSPLTRTFSTAPSEKYNSRMAVPLFSTISLNQLTSYPMSHGKSRRQQRRTSSVSSAWTSSTTCSTQALLFICLVPAISASTGCIAYMDISEIQSSASIYSKMGRLSQSNSRQVEPRTSRLRTSSRNNMKRNSFRHSRRVSCSPSRSGRINTISTVQAKKRSRTERSSVPSSMDKR